MMQRQRRKGISALLRVTEPSCLVFALPCPGPRQPKQDTSCSFARDRGCKSNYRIMGSLLLWRFPMPCSLSPRGLKVKLSEWVRGDGRGRLKVALALWSCPKNLKSWAASDFQLPHSVYPCHLPSRGRTSPPRGRISKCYVPTS